MQSPRTTNALYSVQPACACIGSRLCRRSDPQYDCSWKTLHSSTALIRGAIRHVLLKLPQDSTWTKKKSYVHGTPVSLTRNEPGLYRSSWWLFDPQIPIGRNGGTGTSRLYRIQCSSSSVPMICIFGIQSKYLKDC